MASAAATLRSAATARPTAISRAKPIAIGLLVAVAALGLFARIMAYPLRHDEQMYLPVGALLAQGDLYRDFGFNNLPNLPRLLHMVFSAAGTDHYLLTGRLVIFAGWLLAAAAMALLVRRATGSALAAVVAVLALWSSPLLLGAAGMLVTNNFLPLPFALLGTHLFIAGLDRPQPSRLALVASGLCLALAAGFKANYIFLAPPFALAALLLPRHLAVPERLVAVALPFLAGGIIGALPVLIPLASDPDSFIAHVLHYHRGPHLAYWLAKPDLDGPKVMSLGGKVQLAQDVWLGGGALLIPLAALYLVLVGALGRSRKPVWPAALVAALVAGAALVAFVPTPAFPQYYAAPIPFALALVALLHGRLDPRQRAAAATTLRAIAALLLITGAPRLLADLPRLAHPTRWTGNHAHAAGQAIADAVGQRGRLATLAPVYALEAGLPVYPELAAGPLVYRVGDLIPAADRRFYRLVSPTTVGRLLTDQPPAALLVGYEGALDAPLEAYARHNGYRALALPELRGRYGDGILYVRPDGAPHG